MSCERRVKGLRVQTLRTPWLTLRQPAERYATPDTKLKSFMVSVPHPELTFNLFSYPLFENKLEVVGVPCLGGTTTLQKGGGSFAAE